ncbi:aldose epimerase family protein [Sphingobacterium arenae]|uniref:Aldose 1-epimerase n=1 Tax=Sphingobacterium arenae TaxID=1280598 RepID=A0ABR7XZJ4_9SPHI|nr:aldose epimerase family protein [Sphingobacterium arenae]MBD1424479.1 galactose mutarotase [Sphingobacterium arenae]
MKRLVIKNKQNMHVEVLDWGCRIIALKVPDKSGRLIDAVLNYPNLADYKNDPYYVGGTVGRYANRIAQGRFTLEQLPIQLTTNEKIEKNHLHGGEIGFDKRYWNVVDITDNAIEMTLTSLHGEEGYPGMLIANTRYELSDDNELTIKYTAKSTQTTIANITNHSYFNLSDEQLSIDGHEIKVEANFYTPLDLYHLPKYPFKEKVDNTVFDLRQFKDVGHIKDVICNANYCIEKKEGNQVQRVATILHIETGRQLTIFSDYPSLQVYFGNYLTGKLLPFQGLCCEPHFAPNSPNIITYPSAILKPGEEYCHVIRYQFENF